MAELQARMSSREFAEWAAFDQVEPIGDRRGDIQAAVVASTIGNAYRDRKRRRKPFGPGDFMPLARAWEKVEPRPEEALPPMQLTDEGKRSLWQRFRAWAKG